MLLGALTRAVDSDPYYGYPPWLVIAAGALVAALLLWIFGKLLKWVLWVLIVVVLVGGLIMAVRMLFEP
jgi:hypothetical protein